MAKRLLFITGNPGVGKTTVLLRIIQALKSRGCNVGGMVSREVRVCGKRIGFETSDLSDGRKGWLAHVNQRYGPRIGKYRVNLEDLDSIGVDAISNAVENAEVIAIDEVGPMELCSERFKEAVRRVMESGKLVVGIIHWKAKGRLIEEIRTREDAKIFEVSCANRETLHEMVIRDASEFLARTTR